MKPTLRLWRRIFTLAVVSVCAAALALTLAGGRIETDLAALLPQEEQPDAVLRVAEEANRRQLDGRVVLLAGSKNAEAAFQTASKLAEQWRKSGVFARVDSNIRPDLARMRADILRLGLAVMPSEQRQWLFEEPQRYFQERAEAAVNPFAAPQLLPLEQDWLGFGRFAVGRARPDSRLQWHADNGMLYAEDSDGLTWVWLVGTLPERDSMAAANPGLLPLIRHSRDLAAADGVQTLAAGGALFAAHSRVQAERESRWMAAAGLLLTFSLLLFVFRSARVFWLLLPLAAGLGVGLAAVLAVFGTVHIFTIVVGTSLVGMLVDFPLHWLAPSLYPPQPGRRFSDGRYDAGTLWQPQAAMQTALPVFAVSLAVTAAGYAALWFTPLPVLRQTAVFSGFALLGAFGATVLWLPQLFARYRAKPTAFTAWAARWHEAGRRIGRRFGRKGWWLVGALFLAGGLWRADWRDDIRQWADMPSEMLAEAQQIAAVAGMDFGARYIVAEAASEDALLHKNAEIRRFLQPLVAQNKLTGVQSLDQWLLPAGEQRKLRNRLGELAELPQAWQAMSSIGVPRATMRRALQDAAAAPVLTLSDGLRPELAEAWRPLYLGEIAPQRFASVIRLNGLTDEQAVLSRIDGLKGVHWADTRSRLNRLFEAARNQAAWLKLASYALAALLLWRVFDFRRGSTVLAVPLAAALMTAAVLGWAGIPLNLFAVFGLLLVSAVGVDYAVYAASARHSAQARVGGMTLAALTTGISFVPLSFSSTPAVAAFGTTVAVGVAFNLWLSGRLAEQA